MVAISNPPAKTRESVSADTPSAYGNARHYRMAGPTGNGSAGTADETMMTASGNWGRGLRAGRLSMTDNVVGYAGYIFNAELVSAGSTGLYTVRHRHYAPDLGRWLSRDPIGYVDGMSLYEYVRSLPTIAMDPLGLTPSFIPGRNLGPGLKRDSVNHPLLAPPLDLINIPDFFDVGSSESTVCWNDAVKAKARQVAAACKGAAAGGMKVRIRCATGPRGGKVQPRWFHNRIDITINCHNHRGKRHSCSIISATIIHELEHARQACKMGFRRPCAGRRCFNTHWNDYDNGICQEVGAYCSEPMLGANCDSCLIPKDSPRDLHAICSRACGSLEPESPPGEKYDTSYNRCLEIARDCRNGRLRR